MEVFVLAFSFILLYFIHTGVRDMVKLRDFFLHPILTAVLVFLQYKLLSMPLQNGDTLPLIIVLAITPLILLSAVKKGIRKRSELKKTAV